MMTPGTDILEYGSSRPTHTSWPQDLLDEETARRHLSPEQFGRQAVAEGDGLDGPLGSYGDPGPAAAYWQNSGVLPETGVGI